MREILVYDAVVVEPEWFESGLPRLVEGQRVDVAFDRGVAVVSGKQGGSGEWVDLKVMVVSKEACGHGERGRDWIWQHLILEAPWAGKQE